MSTIKVDTIRNYDSAVDFSQGFNIGGASIIQSYTESATVPETPTPVNGDYWWDTANEVLYRYMDGGFRALGVTPSTAWWGARGMRVGGQSSSTDGLEYFDLSVTSGNSTDFGDLLNNAETVSSAGDSSRGLCLGGHLSNLKKVIQYWAFATTGNATDFGDLINDAFYGGAVSNAVRAIVGSGANSSYQGTNPIEYVTIQTTGNGTDFGDLSEARYFFSTTNDLTHGIFIGGYNTNYTDRMDKITMDTTGNATDIGNFTGANSGGASGVCSDNTTGIVMGGNKSNSVWNNDIGKLTIATAGNASDFGDLSAVRAYGGQTSNVDNARGMSVAGWQQSAAINTLEYITISTPGNATDYGDLVGNTSTTPNGKNAYCSAVSGKAS